jgi:methionyl aminopeptidase
MTSGLYSAAPDATVHANKTLQPPERHRAISRGGSILQRRFAADVEPSGALEKTMSIENKHDLDGLREAGRIVRTALDEMERHTLPGVSTLKLNEIGADVLRRNQARSAPMLIYGFPAEICISVNDEIVHGIPSFQIIRTGDLVKLDVTVEKDSYIADAARTVLVGPASEERRELVACAKRAFYKGMQVARAGNRVNAIGRAISHEVSRGGFSIVQGLAGHGVGRAIHEEPSVPNEYDSRARRRLTVGLVLAVEPMISAGSGTVFEAEDGWTIKTADRSMTAHYENTIVITRGQPLILTQ